MPRILDTARRLLPFIAGLGVVLLIAGILGYQFSSLRQGAPDPRSARRALPSGNQVEQPRLQSVEGVRPVTTEYPDLEGQQEPTEEELIRYAIARYLDELRAATAANPDKINAFPQNRAELLELMRNLPPEAVPIIAKLLREEQDFMCRRVLIDGLADMGYDAAAAALRDYFLERVHDRSLGSELGYIVRALGRSEAQTAYQALYDFVGNGDEDVRIFRSQFVQSLGHHSMGSQAIPLFFDLLGQDADGRDGDGHDGVRNSAAQAVKNVAKRDPQAALPTLPQLIEGYRSEAARQRARQEAARQKAGLEGGTAADVTVPYIKQTTLGAIGQLGDPSAVPFLLEVGTTEPLAERLSASAALARIGGAEALSALREIYANTDAKLELVNAIGLLREGNALPFLQDVATSAESVAVRQRALRGIADIGGAGAVEALRAILAVEQPGLVRREAEARLDFLTEGRR